MELRKSDKKEKKFRVTVWDGPRRTTVHFGAAGMSDYTKHKDPRRKQRYLRRHRAREDWTRRGISTAGFWSRWLLWNLPSIHASKKDIASRFRVRFT